MNAAQRARMEGEDMNRKVGQLESEVSSIKEDVRGIKGDLAQGFSRVFDRMDRVSSPKPTPWAVIFAAVGVLASLLVSLALWANAYFGQGIAAAAREAQRSHENIVEMRLDLKFMAESLTRTAVDAAVLKERSEQNRTEIDRLRAATHP